MIKLGYLYAARIGRSSKTVQATSRDHSGTIHCRVYSPGTDWHGIACSFAEAELTKLDLPVPSDGWDILTFQPKETAPPYGEWCRDPAICAGKGYCPKDPSCAD